MSDPVPLKNDLSKLVEVEPPAEPPPASAMPPNMSALSPEEQMARFEDALKESDWGHQPC
jgi:hypothetical protein